MSDPRDPSAALARAAAQIAQLQAQVTSLSTANAGLATRVVAAEGSRDANAVQITDLKHQLDQVNSQHGAIVADLQTQLDTAKALAVKNANDRLALSAKFDQLYGELSPTESGIVRGPQPYVTTKDGVSHVTLAEARVHLIMLETGASKAQAEGLVRLSTTLVPLIQRAAGVT